MAQYEASRGPRTNFTTLGLWEGTLLMGAAGGSLSFWQPLKVYSASASETGGQPSAQRFYHNQVTELAAAVAGGFPSPGGGAMGATGLPCGLVHVVQGDGKGRLRSGACYERAEGS